MLEELKQKVYKANMMLKEKELIILTWGNASGIDREKGLVVIKPSGVPYERLKVGDMVVVDLDGNKIEGDLKPSSDTPTHLELYKNFKNIGGIVHTHSKWATMWAQAGRGIEAYGTTHADYFYGMIPCTRNLTEGEIELDYEKETGKVIVETFQSIDPDSIPSVLVKSHGPFSWGKDSIEAVNNALILEELAHIAYGSEHLSRGVLKRMDQNLLDTHYLRKHGKNAYYGQ
ncbi:L-ribulose-5-phosphate 4-epimerase [Paratissierella segnis]|uniref:L-ribulose-5-phosphate 4-epimerase n=1 Tax=Paratissierella segnis TaxID=2763679 RepID=A0A926IKE1_9FIRM|nr:L-ribulose-5-phosphate 4-epimerase [Paratissierella segnis]MBC8588974.1 L-ribulose-5-phosphate 4-epimerase [Paratissierella segnis]